MHILFLSAWCPLPADNGSKLRIFHILRELARTHTVDLLSFAPEPPGDRALCDLRSICADVELVPETPFANRQVGRVSGFFSSKPRSVVANHSAAMAEAAGRRGRRHYDLVIASELHMAPYALLIAGVPRMLEEIELTVLRDQFRTQRRARDRLRYGLTWWKTQRYVASTLRSFDAATTVSNAELKLLQPLASARTRLAVVPNGVDTSVGSFSRPERETLIYPGALSFDANFDAVRYFIGEILPLVRAKRPNVRLRVTGRATPAQIAALPKAEQIEFTGFLDDVRPAVAGSWAEVVPLRKGGGTRLKVLEALALGTPVIATSKGIEGLALVPERDVLVADTPAAFAAQTLRLLDAPALRASLAEAGQRIVREHYDWAVIGRTLNDVVAACGAPYGI